MSLDRLLTQTGLVRRIGVGAADRYGNETAAETSSYSSRCYLELTDATEVIVDRETYVSNWRLFLPPGSAIDASDRFDFDGRTFEVVGKPDRLWNPRLAAEHHVEARLREVTG